ncbi:hypothetical protein D9M68_749800 [compost metagenome]
MRYLVLLFAFYVAALTLMPCGDKSEVSSIKYAASFKAQTGAHSDCNADPCSPCCACTCCSVSRHLLGQPAPKFMNESVSDIYAEYSNHAIENQNIAIWQPPQFS